MQINPKLINNIYTTEEQVIGKWLDSKKLYRKTYTGIVPAINNSWGTLFTHAEINIKLLYVTLENSNETIFPRYESLNYNFSFRHQSGGSFQIFGNGYSNYNYEITIEYTKN